jgi:hypothetical protein
LNEVDVPQSVADGAYDAAILSAACIAALISIYFSLYGVATVFQKSQAVEIFGGEAMQRRGRVKLLRVCGLVLCSVV